MPTLYSAGHRTTRDLFGNGVDLVLRRGVQLGLAAPDMMVGEMRRLATPTHYVARVPTDEISLDGIEIAAGTPVTIFLAAANRDPATYETLASACPFRGLDELVVRVA